MTAVGVTAGWTLLSGTAGGADTIPDLAFDSTGSLLDADGETLTDDSLIAVRAETTAYNVDEDGNGELSTTRTERTSRSSRSTVASSGSARCWSPTTPTSRTATRSSS